MARPALPAVSCPKRCPHEPLLPALTLLSQLLVQTVLKEFKEVASFFFIFPSHLASAPSPHTPFTAPGAPGTLSSADVQSAVSASSQVQQNSAKVQQSALNADVAIAIGSIGAALLAVMAVFLFRLNRQVQLLQRSAQPMETVDARSALGMSLM